MIARLFRLFPERAPFVRLVALQVLSAVLEGALFVLLVPALSALFAPEANLGDVRNWVLAMIGVGALYAAVEVRARNRSSRLAGQMMVHLQHSLARHVARLPLGWFSGNQVGRLSRDVSSSALESANVIAIVAPKIVGSLVTPLTVGLLTFLIDWRMALAFIVMIPPALLVLAWAGNIVAKVHEPVHEAAAEAAARTVELGHAQAVLRSTGQVQEGYAQFEASLERQLRTYLKNFSALALPELAFVSVIQAGTAAIISLGVYLALGGDIGAGQAIALLVLTTRFVEPLTIVANMFGGTRQADVALRHIEDVLNEPPMPDPSPGRVPAGFDIELDHVDFSYDRKQVLHDVSLHIPAGSTVALVGPSGAGKTTAVRLIARFWDVTSGAVRIGGVDVREIPYKELMGRIAMVFQNVYLFDTTIEENVRMAKPGATSEEVREIARIARLDEIVERLPEGWNTRVGEGGAMLSGGERQRVSIARALLKDAPIVLLDEATAAIDPENEAMIHEALSQLINDASRTVVVIAHRLQTVVTADQIVVLDGGRIAEVGDHEKLIAAKGRYAAFWAERSRAEGWRIQRTG